MLLETLDSIFLKKQSHIVSASVFLVSIKSLAVFKFLAF